MKAIAALACVFALAAGVAAADDAAGASLPDSTARWNGMLHVRVTCAAGTPTCRGAMSVYDPADSVHSLDGTDYKLAGGETISVTIDPSSAHANAKLSSLRSIVVHLDAYMADGREPSPKPPPYSKTLKLVHPSKPGLKPLGPPTRRQVVKDRRGDGRGGQDIVRATATRKGRLVVFQVTTVGLLNQHDSFGNPTTPQLEFPWPKSQGGPGRTPIQMGGDGALRGYSLHNWPKVSHSVGGHSITWRVPLKYLAKRSFRWRAYSNDGDRVLDAAPNKGYKTFVR